MVSAFASVIRLFVAPIRENTVERPSMIPPPSALHFCPPQCGPNFCIYLSTAPTSPKFIGTAASPARKSQGHADWLPSLWRGRAWRKWGCETNEYLFWICSSQEGDSETRADVRLLPWKFTHRDYHRDRILYIAVGTGCTFSTLVFSLVTAGGLKLLQVYSISFIHHIEKREGIHMTSEYVCS